jgi:uncharacterized membrane protein
MATHDKKDQQKITTGKTSRDTVSEFITKTFGSLAFLLIYLAFVLGWIAWNQHWIPGLKPFDRFPYPELEMILSAFAIFLSVMVLISQKRQARLEKIAQQVEFEVNLRSEKEITKVLQMLLDIQKKLGIEQRDPELENMMEQLDADKLHQEHRKQQGEND